MSLQILCTNSSRPCIGASHMYNLVIRYQTNRLVYADMNDCIKNEGRMYKTYQRIIKRNTQQKVDFKAEK